MSFYFMIYLMYMFGITPQPTRPTSTAGRITQNKLETVRTGSNTTTYDNSAAERMKMEHLKQERERREKERNRMMYDAKKRELDQLVNEADRFKVEQRRLESELVKYEHDVASIKQSEKVNYAHVPILKKEELQLVQLIQKLESDLQQAKTRHQKTIQDIAHLEQSDKTAQADIHKREAYATGVKTKLEDVKKRSADDQKKITILQTEVNDLKKKI